MSPLMNVKNGGFDETTPKDREEVAGLYRSKVPVSKLLNLQARHLASTLSTVEISSVKNGGLHTRMRWKRVGSDEAHFLLNGYVNKQNCRIWSEANPEVDVETPLHPEKLTVWCVLWAGGIIGILLQKR
ncbi:hypothetical protein TNCV_4726711 [Trichonephila clavipes]|nr:hypothetical protein TNCV_4726711 [Trichonephila clavipes]